MSYYFFDSSALVKRYVTEIGSTWVRSITDPNTTNIILIASITRVELVSAAMRRSREGSLAPRTAMAVRIIMTRHSKRQYTLIALTETIIKLAEDLLEAHPLRAYDSVQLASALETNSRLLAAALAPLTFISSDNRLLTIALAAGLNVDDPNKHP